MQENPVFVVVEVVSIQDADGLRTYSERASELIGPVGGAMLGHGGPPVDGDPGIGRLGGHPVQGARA